MAIIPGILPPSRATWELISYGWQFFPLFTVIQWFTTFYPQGKTSIESRLNLPGKWAWTIMELPGVAIVLYTIYTLPGELGLREPLPWGNYAMAGMYTIHYLYRAIISPLFLNPSMSPIHPLVFLSAFAWQVANGLSIGGWLGGHGPITAWDWTDRIKWINVGMVIWGWGLLGNMFHDDELREIRREAARRQHRENAKSKGADAKGVPAKVNVDKVYMLPKNGLFNYVLYAHYLCEWVEWGGWWMVGGWNCVPARSFLLNEIAAMLPRAIAGRQWYIEKFGKDKVGNRKAIIPGLL